MAIKGDNAALDAYTLKLSTESILGSNSVVHTLLHEADDVDTDCTIAVRTCNNMDWLLQFACIPGHVHAASSGRDGTAPAG